MKSPTGVPAEREVAVLERAGIPQEAFGAFPDLLAGSRRRYVIRPQNLEVTADERGLRFTFTLPAGVYATTLLEELFELTPGQHPSPEAS